MDRLYQLGAFELVPAELQGNVICSFLFLVPKPPNKWRVILNFVPSNNYSEKVHFKMETIRDVKDLLKKGDLMTSLDLKDAYLHMFFRKDFRRFCAFMWKGKMWWFISMMFGHLHAPRWWTKLLKVVAAYIRSKGIRCVVYIDDIILLHGTNRVQAISEYRFVLSLLLGLGLTVNASKGVSSPVTRLDYLGFIIDSSKMMLFVPSKKVKEIVKMAKKLSSVKVCSVRILASFLGKISSVAEAVLPWRLFTRSLLLDKHRILRATKSWDAKVVLSEGAISELLFWTKNIQVFNGKNIKHLEPDWITLSDSSAEGFGGEALGTRWRLAQEWSSEQTLLHNNYLEALAATEVIKNFILEEDLRDCSLLHKSDNTVAVSYINKQGGRIPEISKPIEKVWSLCLERRIILRGEHIPGVDLEGGVDFLSRMFKKQSEWSLPRVIFKLLEERWGPFLIDLFATQYNSQLPEFAALWKDPLAVAWDSLAFQWKDHSYLFPPFILLGRVLKKVVLDQVQVVLITPLWKSATWWPAIQQLMVDVPMILPEVLVDLNQVHQRLKWPLVGWLISGRASEQMVFQKRQLNWLRDPLVPHLQVIDTGDFIQSGVSLEDLIQ
jgi:hypothetical protein